MIKIMLFAKQDRYLSFGILLWCGRTAFLWVPDPAYVKDGQKTVPAWTISGSIPREKMVGGSPLSAGADPVPLIKDTTGLPETVLAARGKAVWELQKKGVDPLVAIGRSSARRPYDFRPQSEERKSRRITEPWRLTMKERLETTKAGELHRLRKQTVEPVLGIIKSIMGSRRFCLISLAKVTTEWSLVALAYNCKRIARIQAV